MKKIWNLQTLLYMALCLALLASLTHVAYAFSTTNGNNSAESYISAVAIDLGLLALAAGIAQRGRARRATWPLWGGVLLFSLISTYANWLSGIVHVAPITADVGGIGQWLISLRPIILSAVLPLLVIYLSEIVSHDHQAEIIEAQRAAKRANVTPNVPLDEQSVASLQKANESRKTSMDVRREQIADQLKRGMSKEQIMMAHNISRATYKRDLVALNISQNGDSPS